MTDQGVNGKTRQRRRYPGGIKASIILSFMLLVTVIVLFLSLFSYRYTTSNMENVAISYTNRLLEEVNYNIDSYIDNMKSMGQVIVDNQDVRSLMSFYNLHRDKRLGYYEDKELEDIKSRVSAHMQVVAGTRSDISNIAIISQYGDVVLSDQGKSVNPFSGHQEADWYRNPLQSKEEVFVSPSHVQNLVEGEYNWVISISKAVTDPATGEVTGVMVIDLNYRSIEDICENAQLGKSGYIYLIDSAENLIFHPQQHLLYSGIKNEEIASVLALEPGSYMRLGNRIYLRDDSPLTGWSAVGALNTAELIRDRMGTVRYYGIMAGLAIVMAAVIAVILSSTITKPLRRLEATMHRVEQGDLAVRSAITANNEIGQLSRTFDTMVGRVKDLMERAVADEEEKRKSEIKALQAQINPHFLYNTLDTIIWMSASGQNEEVVEVTSALAHLFRTSINDGDSLVPVRMEVENIQSYLTIQKMRYKDKLSFAIDIPQELLGLCTPKLILQPIVENALYHGIKPAPQGGQIRIGAWRDGEDLLFVVEDNGVGMTSVELRAIQNPADRGGRSIGINNVNNRIRLHFGPEYGLRYKSRPGKGTRVEIRLPAVEEGGRDDG